MHQRVIKRHGEAADISVTASLDGVDDDLTGWTGVISMRLGSVNGTEVLSSALTLASGAFTLAIDTGDYDPGTYVYNVLLTDETGIEYPSDNVTLIIQETATTPA